MENPSQKLFQTSLEKMWLHPTGWQRNFLGCQVLREWEWDYITAEINGIHIRKVQEIALYGTKKPRLMGRHTEKAGIPLATCGLEHTVCHQEGLSKVVTGSRSSLWGLQETACSGAQLILSITECFHIHISHRPWSKNKKKQNAAINQKRSQEEKPLSSSSALY